MRRRRRVGVICIILGAVLLLAALSLAVYNRWTSEQALQNSNQVLNVIDSQIEQNADALPTYETEPNVRTETAGGGSDAAGSAAEAVVVTEMDTIEVEGYLYIGTLNIPRLGLELPVMDEWSYPGLRVSPGRYVGSVWTDDLVICGHNYDRHFGNLKNLETGDAVIFTDVNGNEFDYEVQEVIILQPTDVEEMITGDWDLTLFTCTYGGQTRVTVRCDRAAEEEE